MAFIERWACRSLFTLIVTWRTSFAEDLNVEVMDSKHRAKPFLGFHWISWFYPQTREDFASMGGMLYML